MADDASIVIPDKLKARFWSKVDKRGPDECWPWKGWVSEFGHGTFYFTPRLVNAHRASLMLVEKRWFRTDEFICHTCDNPRCVNPRHLYVGSAKTNARDASVRRRHQSYVSPEKTREAASKAKIRFLYDPNVANKFDGRRLWLMPDTVMQIIEALGSDSLLNIAKKFGVSKHTVWKIATRRTWSLVWEQYDQKQEQRT